MNPFIKRVPDDEKEDFINEFAERLMEMYKEQEYDTEYLIKSKVVIIYAKK